MTSSSASTTSSTSAFDQSVVDVLMFWFGGDFVENLHTKWFTEEKSAKQAEIDAMIIEKFGVLLKKAESLELECWKSTPHSYLALIVVLDQFSRHIYRTDPNRDQLVQKNDAITLSYTEDFITKGWEPLLTPVQTVFMLMPFRHSANLDRLKYVLDRVAKAEEIHLAMGSLLDRFKRATLRRLQHLEGQQWKDGMDILEREPFATDYVGSQETKPHRCVENFLNEQRQRLGDDALKTLAVSLSGGVDSMVLTTILTTMRNDNATNNFKIVGVHIDYGNRPESHAEADYLAKWCSEHDVIFRRRTITECKRGVTPRDEYEKLSREIRFSSYVEVMKELGIVGMMFGHHQGDIQENVISNMMKRCQLLDISGMGPEGIVNDVMIWRPLSPLIKDDIYDYAHRYGVPYFKDTTPKWSTRGTMRNQLMPLLHEMYGEGYLRNLSALSHHSQQLSDLVHHHLLKPFLDGVHMSPLAVWADCGPFLKMPVYFWREVLRHVCHEMLGMGLIAEGPIKDQLLFRLGLACREPGVGSNGEGFVELKKGFRFYLSGTSLIFFRKPYFPSVPYYTNDQTVTLGSMFTLGPWTISTEHVTNLSEHDATHRLTVWDVVSGDFCYYLPFTTSLILHRDKTLRPKVLRGVPKVITDPIPLVVTRTNFAPNPPTEWVKIHIRGDMQKNAHREIVEQSTTCTENP